LSKLEKQEKLVVFCFAIAAYSSNFFLCFYNTLQQFDVRIVFVLKLCGCYVPGWESVQASILW